VLTPLGRVLAPLGRVPGGSRLWIALVSLGFVLAALFSHGRQLLQLRPDPQGLLWLCLGLGFTLLSLVVNGLAWGVILRWLALRPRWEPLVSLFVATNLRKYLPGGVWHLASRVQVLRSGSEATRAPVGTGLALVAVLLDPLVAAVAALALVSLGGWQNGLALLCLLPLGLLLPRWLRPLLLRLERKRARDLGLELELSGGAGMPQAPSLRGYPWPPLLGLRSALPAALGHLAGGLRPGLDGGPGGARRPRRSGGVRGGAAAAPFDLPSRSPGAGGGAQLPPGDHPGRPARRGAGGAGRTAAPLAGPPQPLR
jgi:hypothetical protein